MNSISGNTRHECDQPEKGADNQQTKGAGKMEKDKTVERLSGRSCPCTRCVLCALPQDAWDYQEEWEKSNPDYKPLEPEEVCKLGRVPYMGPRL
jgi:hypothetical protein